MAGYLVMSHQFVLANIVKYCYEERRKGEALWHMLLRPVLAYPIVFTHGDIATQNIIMCKGRIAAMLN
jgi:aminoglycoside/choline kinase family phosphotransferase